MIENEKLQVYYWDGLLWEINYDDFENPYSIALCPKQKCCCKLVKSKETYVLGEYKYQCIKCNFNVTLEKNIESKGVDFLNVFDSLKYENVEIINIEDELIRVQRQEIKDEDYWIDVKMSKNKNNETQLMVLAGSKKSKDKTQLFLDPSNERLTFDQNNHHPSHIFTKVVGIFKNSKSEIHSNDNS